MAAITVRNLDDEVRDELRLRAASHGHSMEAEVRSILTAAVSQRRHRPNALMDLYWAGRGGVEAEAEFVEPRGEAEQPRVDFSGAEFG
ncbi:FitA-like ribbon-helix-helix domain-containing protein [Janibacter indicus]|uniref:Plasmid stability protein n=2 Tax=Janibacter TaxID=53457 RepID=A0A1W2CH30_9MICO|nr:Arc family DNA-binding protein [Janibacter sp. YB324]SMC83928.1 Plasmid stability protein [Janibacter indicus]